MMNYKCRKHPKYKAKLKPRCICEACWWLWFNKRVTYYAEGLSWIGLELELC